MDIEELRDKAKQELSDNGVPDWLSWNDARDWLHDGRISQDMFDLYDDMWTTFEYRISVPSYQRQVSINNLRQRYE